MSKHLKHIKIAYRSSVVFLCLILLTQTQPATQPDKKVMINTPRRGTAASTSEHMQPPIYSQEINIRFQDSDFYRTITNNNLFRPLGWQPSRPREIYRLLGTLTPNDGQTKAQAILQSTTTKTIYVVNIGDTLDPDTIITNIQSKQVTLEKAGQKPRVLTLNLTLLRK